MYVPPPYFQCGQFNHYFGAEMELPSVIFCACNLIPINFRLCHVDRGRIILSKSNLKFQTFFPLNSAILLNNCSAVIFSKEKVPRSLIIKILYGFA